MPGARRPRRRVGLLAQVGRGELRFVHALTRDAVCASIPTSDVVTSHRAAAEALEAHWAGELDEHLAELAWHRLALAPYGEGAAAREWALRAAEASVRRLAFEEAIRLYRAALAVPGPWPGGTSPGRIQLDLARVCVLAGDVDAALAAAVAAVDEARDAAASGAARRGRAGRRAGTGPGRVAVLSQLCDEALAGEPRRRSAGRASSLAAATSPSTPATTN